MRYKTWNKVSALIFSRKCYSHAQTGNLTSDLSFPMGRPCHVGVEMKTKLTWFIIGAIVSWLTWSVVAYVRARPHDLTTKWPSELRKVYGNVGRPWLRSAVARNVGGFTVCASAGAMGPSAIIAPRGKAIPQVSFGSETSEGFVNSITLSAAGDQSITADLDANGQILKYTVTTGDLLDSHSVAMVDADMDGQFDMRIGPGRHVYLWLNSAWHERVSLNGSTYIDLNGVRTEVALTNGRWKLKHDVP